MTCRSGCCPNSGTGPGKRLKKNIVLTGFMGSGKTSTGVLLAEQLGLEFYDTDDVISQEEEMSIPLIFQSRGEDYFRRRETEVVQKLGQKPPGTCVIATGGGMVMKEENRSALRQNGLLVFLDVPAEEVYRRLAGKDDRPLLQVEDPLQVIKNLLLKRRPYYLLADIRVETGAKGPEKVAGEIIEKIL